MAMNTNDTKLYSRIYKKYRTMEDDSSYSDHITQREQAWDFYDGEQWTAKELEKLADRGQPAITVNQIASKVDALTGIEAQNRTAIKYTPRTFNPKSRAMADALTSFGYQVQDVNDTSEQKAERFKDMSVGGIGWMRVTYENNAIKTEYIPAEEMLWDVTDNTANLTNQRMSARVKWVDIEAAKLAFPKRAKDIDNLVKDNEDTYTGDTYSTEESNSSYIRNTTNKIKIVEVQYLQASKAYRFIDLTGLSKEVFDKEYAEANKQEGTEIIEIIKDKVYEGYFTDSILLSHYPLKVQVGKLEYQPLVWKRRKSDGMPYGVVASVIDLQREINKRRSKALHILNSKQVIAEAGAIDNNSVEGMRKEVARPDGVVLYKDGKKFQIDTNQQLAASQLDIMKESQFDLQSTMGISDDLAGLQTNARSGVAIAARQQASVSKQSFAFDRIKHSNKELGRLLLAYMQQVSRDVLVQIIDNDDVVDEIIVNEVQEIDGKEVIVTDISAEHFNVVIDETPEFASAPQEAADRLERIMNSPNIAQMALTNQAVLEALLIPNAGKITQAFTPQQPQTNGASPEEGAPNPQQPIPSPQA